MPILETMKRLAARSETFRTSLTSLALVAVRIIGTALTFFYTLLIARVMTPHDVGILWAIWSSSFIASNLANLNIGAAAVREIVAAKARGDNDRAAGFVIACRWVLLAASPLVMAGYAGFNWWIDPTTFEAHWIAFALATVSLPLLGWVQINASHGAALFRALSSQTPRELVRPFVFLVAFATFVAVGFKPSVDVSILLYLVAIILTALLQFALLSRDFTFMRTAVPNTAGWHEWVKSGLALLPARVIGEHLKNLMIVCAALGLSNADTAKFAVALSLVSFLNFGISAVEMTFSPRISRAIANDNPAVRDKFLAISCLLKLIPVLIASVVIVALAEPILGLFGKDYRDAVGVIGWLLLLPISKAVFGPGDLLLQVAMKRTALLVIVAVGIAAMVMAIGWAGSTYGATAAAAAGALAFAATRCSLWLAALLMTGTDCSVFSAVTTVARSVVARKKNGNP